MSRRDGRVLPLLDNGGLSGVTDRRSNGGPVFLLHLHPPWSTGTEVGPVSRSDGCNVGGGGPVGSEDSVHRPRSPHSGRPWLRRRSQKKSGGTEVGDLEVTFVDENEDDKGFVGES